MFIIIIFFSKGNNFEPIINEKNSKMAYIATKDELDLLLDQKLEKFTEKILEVFKGPNFSQRKWLKAAELKKILPLSDYRITEMRVRGLLAFQKIGGTYYYAVESINDLINSKKK